MCPTPYTVVSSRADGPISARAVVAVYSFSTDAGGRMTFARSENSGCLVVRSYTYAPSAAPPSASWWLKSACSPARASWAPAAGTPAMAGSRSPSSRMRTLAAGLRSTEP